MILPPNFNIETGRFDEPKLIDQYGNVVNEDEMDVFELARLKGVKVTQLKQLMPTEKAKQQDESQLTNVTGQKHSKKDYDKLKKMDIHEVIMMTKEERVRKAFKDESIAKDIVKIEKKKGFKRSDQ